MPCTEKCLEEKQLEGQVLDFLKSVHISEDELKEPLAIIEKERANERQTGDGLRESIHQALEICQRNMNNLTKLRYREFIREEEFIKQREELAREEIGLRQRLEQLDTERWIEPSRNLFLFSNRAVFWLTHGTVQEKRLILATVGSNLSLSAKKLSVDAKEPFRLLQNNGHIRNWCTIVNDVRTFLREHDDVSVPVLPVTKGRFLCDPDVLEEAA